MSFSNFITLAFFTLISYIICGMTGAVWKDAFAFGRVLDKIHLYLGILYSGIAFTTVGTTIIDWVFRSGISTVPSIFSWGFCCLGVYLIGFIFFIGYSYRDVRFERLKKEGWNSPDQVSKTAMMPEHIGWTFRDLPEILKYPELHMQTPEGLIGEDDHEELDPLFRGRDMDDGDGLIDLLRIVRTFLFRSLFRIAFAGFLVSCSLVRSSARSNRSIVEDYLKNLRNEETPVTS